MKSMQPYKIHVNEISTWQTLPKSYWMNNSVTNKCTICTKLIRSGIFKSNKHHCRYCGNIVCDKCSKNRVYKSGVNYNRICTKCYHRAIEYLISGNKDEPLTWKYHCNRNELLSYGYSRKYIFENNDYFDVILISIATWIGYNDRLSINKRDIHCLEITNSGQCLERIEIEDECYYHAFGEEIIGMKQKKIWWLKIKDIDQWNKNNKIPNICIGIIDNRLIHRIGINDNFLKITGCGYGINLAEKINNFQFRINDTITMELDMTINDDNDDDDDAFGHCGTLKFTRNGYINLIDKKIYVNMNMKYRLAISMYSTDKIVLL